MPIFRATFRLLTLAENLKNIYKNSVAPLAAGERGLIPVNPSPDTDISKIL